MKKITRITTQKNNKNRYNVFLDNGHGEAYGFSVDEDVLIKYNLRKDLELDNELIKMISEQDEIQKSYIQTINYLSYRMRTEKEIRDYLLKKDTNPEHIPAIIKKLMDENLINDLEFATMFVNTRIGISTKGPALVKKELLLKGVSEIIANKAIEKYDEKIQYEKAEKLVNKRLKQSNKHSFRKQLQQIQANLIRSGFSQEVIQEILANVDTEKDEDAEWNALLQQGRKLVERHGKKFSGHELTYKVKEGLYRQGFQVENINRFIAEHLLDE